MPHPPHPKNLQNRIRLVAGTILTVATLLVGVSVFMVMERHAEELLSKSLQLSLQSRVQLTRAEIGTGFDRTMAVATRPMLADQLEQLNTGADEGTARMTLDRSVRAFLPTGLTAIAVLDKDGRELARVGAFTQMSELTVPLNLPGRVQLMWDGQLLLHAVADIKREGRVVGTVMMEVSLPVTTSAFKDASYLGKTGVLALCAPFGLNMQCFPATLNPHVQTLSQRSPKGNLLPMAHALAGKTGFVTARDSRDQEVVAAYAPVGDLGLGMVLKMDSAELFAPVWQQLRFLIPLLVGVLVIALLLLRWLLAPLVLRLVRSEAQASEMNASLGDSEARFRTVVATLAEGVLLRDADGKIVDCNASAERIIGKTLAQMKGFVSFAPEWQTLREDGSLMAVEDRASAVALRTGLPQSNVVTGYRKPDGSVLWGLLNAQPLFKRPASTPSGFVTTIIDITKRKQVEDRLNYLAHHDALTGLPNRVQFKERLEQTMIAAQAHDALVAVVFLDLVRFKNVNDTLGHDAGDQMLKEVGQRLLETVRSGDTVARLLGDEFTFVLTDIGHAGDVARVAQKILHAFELPFHIAGRDLVMSANLGIAMFPLDTDNADELLSYADLAMYSAKAAGGNRYQFYAAEMTAQAVDALALENEMRQGLQRGEFFLNYQPIVDAGGNIVGAEALLRWQHSRRGLIPPTIFIPLAETTGLILPIGQWVLRQACIQATAWRKPNGALLRMSVNVSPRQFRHGDLWKTIATILAETGFAPTALDLEITEGVLMQGEALAQELFYQLSELGLYFSIDDFGTGYSNLAYLKRFPIHSIKIDQSFIRDLITNPNDAAIVKAIIGMAHSLGIKTIAEGVETRRQKEFLLAHGCDLMQGYYFSRPLLPEAFTALLDAGKPLLGNKLLGSDTNFAAVHRTAPSGRAVGSSNLGSDPKNS